MDSLAVQIRSDKRTGDDIASGTHMQGKNNQPRPTALALEQVFSHPRRAEILRYLTQKGDRECTDGAELARALDLSASKVHYHLTVLQGADLITRVAGGRGPSSTGPSFVAVATAGQ